MLYPEPDPTISAAEYQDAINTIPPRVKQLNPAWYWELHPRVRLTWENAGGTAENGNNGLIGWSEPERGGVPPEDPNSLQLYRAGGPRANTGPYYWRGAGTGYYNHGPGGSDSGGGLLGKREEIISDA
ncbi:hypothetical protein TWF281_007460 [Arthrobotrys megalospora]